MHDVGRPNCSEPIRRPYIPLFILAEVGARCTLHLKGTLLQGHWTLFCVGYFSGKECAYRVPTMRAPDKWLQTRGVNARML